MTESERKEFEKHLAMHSAPTIMGVKCANMFSVKQSDRADSPVVGTRIIGRDHIAEALPQTIVVAARSSHDWNTDNWQTGIKKVGRHGVAWIDY